MTDCRRHEFRPRKHPVHSFRNFARNELGSPCSNAEKVNRLRAIVKAGDSHDLAQA
jgi:hypothetical protein